MNQRGAGRSRSKTDLDELMGWKLGGLISAKCLSNRNAGLLEGDQRDANEDPAIQHSAQLDEGDSSAYYIRIQRSAYEHVGATPEQWSEHR